MAVDLRAYIVNKANLIFAARVEQEATLQVQDISRRIGYDFVREARVYPPENAGNRPPVPYWVRGSGLVHANGRVDPRSQNLGPSWAVNSPFGSSTTVDNPATYSPYVHDNAKQAAFHRQHGWRNVTEIGAEIGIDIRRTGESRYSVTRADSYLQQAAQKIGNALQQIFNR
jgi:hypothetical protein